MKIPKGCVCFLIIVVEVLLTANNAESVDCIGANGGTCTEGDVNCLQHNDQCDASRPVEPFDYEKHSDSFDNCKNRLTGGNSTLKPNKGLNSPIFTPYAYDPYYFQLHLSWEAWPYAKGYHVAITVLAQDGESGTLPKNYAYKCIEGGDVTNTSILMEYGFPLAYSSCTKSRDFGIEVIGLPNDFPSPYYRKTTWPDNCFSISNESVCGPHTPEGIDISVQTELLPNKLHAKSVQYHNNMAPQVVDTVVHNNLLPDSTSMMSATIQWSKPSNTIFDVNLYHFLLSSSADPPPHYTSFVVNGTRSIILSPLNTTVEYYIYLEPFQEKVCQHECHLTAISPTRQNCGNLVQKSFSYVPQSWPSKTPSGPQSWPSKTPAFLSPSASTSSSPLFALVVVCIYLCIKVFV